MSEEKEKPNHAMKATEWRVMEKGTLRGFLVLELCSGLILHGMSYHWKEGNERWVGMPGQKFVKRDGTCTWNRIVTFSNSTIEATFQKQALEALDKLLAEAEAGKDKKDGEEEPGF